MRDSWLTAARKRKRWTQHQAAEQLGVSQAYWSLLEHGHRRVSARLLDRLREHFDVPPTLVPLEPLEEPRDGTGLADVLAGALAGLGYPGYSHLHHRAAMNPARLMFMALRLPDLDTRVVEALPWLAWRHHDLDWDWLIERVKIADLQNRLGFVVRLARQVAERKEDETATNELAKVEERLERSRLVREDTLCRESMPLAERRWLTNARSPDAAHWNVVSDLRADRLSYAA